MLKTCIRFTFWVVSIVVISILGLVVFITQFSKQEIITFFEKKFEKKIAIGNVHYLFPRTIKVQDMVFQNYPYVGSWDYTLDLPKLLKKHFSLDTLTINQPKLQFDPQNLFLLSTEGHEHLELRKFFQLGPLGIKIDVGEIIILDAYGEVIHPESKNVLAILDNSEWSVREFIYPFPPKPWIYTIQADVTIPPLASLGEMDVVTDGFFQFKQKVWFQNAWDVDQPKFKVKGHSDFLYKDGGFIAEGKILSLDLHQLDFLNHLKHPIVDRIKQFRDQKDDIQIEFEATIPGFQATVAEEIEFTGKILSPN